jgi:ABC-2 type transport system ATP-binding protein
MNAVEVINLKKDYKHIHALNNVSLAVPEGRIYGLIGPNGAGKTTLIKALAGSLKPDSGIVKVLGMDPLKEKWKLRQEIGYMPQAYALYDDLSARENILFFGRAGKVADPGKKTDEILEFTELKDRANDPVGTFSGGMKKRVSLACALIHNPRVSNTWRLCSRASHLSILNT